MPNIKVKNGRHKSVRDVALLVSQERVQHSCRILFKPLVEPGKISSIFLAFRNVANIAKETLQDVSRANGSRQPSSARDSSGNYQVQSRGDCPCRQC